MCSFSLSCVKYCKKKNKRNALHNTVKDAKLAELLAKLKDVALQLTKLERIKKGNCNRAKKARDKVRNEKDSQHSAKKFAGKPGHIDKRCKATTPQVMQAVPSLNITQKYHVFIMQTQSCLLLQPARIILSKSLTKP